MSETVADHGSEKKGWIGEDWLSLILGLVIFAISLGAFQGNHFLGWGAKMGVWSEAGKAISPISSGLACLSLGSFSMASNRQQSKYNKYPEEVHNPWKKISPN